MNTEALRNLSYARQELGHSFVSELVKLANDTVPGKGDNIQLSRRISEAKAIWASIQHATKEGILNLVVCDNKKDNKTRAEKKADKAQVEKAGIYLARKLALCEGNIPPHEFIKSSAWRPLPSGRGGNAIFLPFLVFLVILLP